MGMYTGLQISVVLKEDLPKDVGHALQIMTLQEDWDQRPNLDIKDRLFLCDRWQSLLCGQSAYFPECAEAQPEDPAFRFFKLVDGKFILNASSSLKNYDQEITRFLEWIAPYVDPEAASECGWYRYEESTSVTYFRFQNGKVYHRFVENEDY